MGSFVITSLPKKVKVDITVDGGQGEAGREKHHSPRIELHLNVDPIWVSYSQWPTDSDNCASCLDQIPNTFTCM